jgi:hypothetical protein
MLARVCMLAPAQLCVDCVDECNVGDVAVVVGKFIKRGVGMQVCMCALMRRGTERAGMIVIHVCYTDARGNGAVHRAAVHTTHAPAGVVSQSWAIAIMLTIALCAQYQQRQEAELRALIAQRKQPESAAVHALLVMCCCVGEGVCVKHVLLYSYQHHRPHRCCVLQAANYWLRCLPRSPRTRHRCRATQ